MTTDDENRVFGALTAFQFMLENLYAYVIASGGGKRADACSTRDEIFRQFEDLPPRGQSDFMIHELALVRLESMWRAIETRVGQSTGEL
jgi:hypothetical protein